jgi:protein phosphatase
MWAGDSRAYLYRDGRLIQLTRDHSHIEDLINRGVITRDQAEHHPGGNVITRAVGVSDNLVLDSAMYEVKDRDIFLLCSDGLYNEVDDEQIRQALGIASGREACNALMEHALAHGARDNVSAVVIRAEAKGQITRTRLNPVRRNAPAGDEGPDDPTTLR